jgi:hypothetical protein
LAAATATAASLVSVCLELGKISVGWYKRLRVRAEASALGLDFASLQIGSGVSVKRS